MKPDCESPGDGLPESPGEPLHFPIEDALDLHAFHPRDLDAVVTEYLWEAARCGLREVRIIHGKGIGVQGRRVGALLSRHAAVESFGPAPAERGHWGATIVRLRPAART
jgi:DNA-nicking Smr family endonuclease